MFKFSENHKPKMRFLKICFLSLFIPYNLYPNIENINFYNSSNIIQMLDKLDVFGKVLYIAAHPDDENTRLITYLANEKKYETAYLSMTRGGGGQNFIGTHLKENLGLIRTQELLKASLSISKFTTLPMCEVNKQLQGSTLHLIHFFQIQLLHQP